MRAGRMRLSWREKRQSVKVGVVGDRCKGWPTPWCTTPIYRAGREDRRPGKKGRAEGKLGGKAGSRREILEGKKSSRWAGRSEVLEASKVLKASQVKTQSGLAHYNLLLGASDAARDRGGRLLAGSRLRWGRLGGKRRMLRLGTCTQSGSSQAASTGRTGRTSWVAACSCAGGQKRAGRASVELANAKSPASWLLLDGTVVVLVEHGSQCGSY
ncbi:hypothetical protein CHU98_g576 [Xylaria longipes]|nr:hypothetical protein CHU98_g576 [Xylaria longipes]